MTGCPERNYRQLQCCVMHITPDGQNRPVNQQLCSCAPPGSMLVAQPLQSLWVDVTQQITAWQLPGIQTLAMVAHHTFKQCRSVSHQTIAHNMATVPTKKTHCTAHARRNTLLPNELLLKGSMALHQPPQLLSCLLLGEPKRVITQTSQPGPSQPIFVQPHRGLHACGAHLNRHIHPRQSQPERPQHLRLLAWAASA